jgi:nitrogen regulatory protein PII-like uncharacterized protein
MSLVKSKKEVVKIELTDKDVIESCGVTHFYMTKYPSLALYTQFLDAGMKNDPEKIDSIARELLRDENGEKLLKEEDDVIDHEIYEHILVLVTQYLLKLKTKKLTQTSQAGTSN